MYPQNEESQDAESQNEESQNGESQNEESQIGEDNQSSVSAGDRAAAGGGCLSKSARPENAEKLADCLSHTSSVNE